MRPKAYSLSLMLVIALTVLCGTAICFDWWTVIAEPNFQPPDSATYIEAANLWFKNNLSVHPTRPWGVAFLCGLPLLLDPSFHDFAHWMFVLNAVLYLASLTFLYRSLSNFGISHKLTFYACIACILCVGLLFANTQVLSEVPYYFVLVLSWFWYSKFYATQNQGYIVFALLALSCSVIIRPGSYYLYLLVLFAAIFYSIRHKKWTFFFALALTYLPILMQSYKMKKQYGNYTVSYIDKYALQDYWCARAIHFKSGENRDRVLKHFYEQSKGFSLPQKAKYADSLFKDQLKHNGKYLLQAYLFNLYENSKGYSSPVYDMPLTSLSWIKNILLFISRFQNLCFSIYALFIGPLLLYFVYKKRKATVFKLLPLQMVLWYIPLSSAVSYWQNDRFHMVFYPLAIVSFVLSIALLKNSNSANVGR